MDIRTLCLGVLTMGDATGYEIKKIFEDRLDLIFHASYGSIYPALNRLTDEGLVSCEEFVQEKRPDKKIYSITAKGRYSFLEEIMKNRHRIGFAPNIWRPSCFPISSRQEQSPN